MTNRINMIREVEGRLRYYKVIFYQTLFGEYRVERIYGACRNQKPTGCKINLFDTEKAAKRYFNDTVTSKYSRGYEIATSLF